MDYYLLKTFFTSTPKAGKRVTRGNVCDVPISWAKTSLYLDSISL